MVTHIPDLFYLGPDDLVKVKWVGACRWSRRIANDVGQQQDDRRREDNTPLVDLQHVKAALKGISQQFGPIDHSNRNRRLPSYKWQYNARLSDRLHRVDFIRRVTDKRNFSHSTLRREFLSSEHLQGMRQALEVTVFTDGSLISSLELLSMSFAAVISYIDLERGRREFVAAGRTTDGPFLSTTAELMALALTVALVPSNVPVTIHSDSKAAIKLAENLLDKQDVRQEYEKSNISYLAAKVRPWFQRRMADTTMIWVKGHSGVEGNEKADQACEEAHADDTPWSTRLVPVPEAPKYRLCVGNQLAPMTAGRLTRKQGEIWAENRFLYHFTRAQRALEATAQMAGPPSPESEPRPTDALPDQPQPALTPLCQPEDKYKWERFQANTYVKALNMARDRAGRWSAKNSRRTTNHADHNRRSYGIKAGYGWLATQERKQLYWPDAYPETAMLQCPRGCGQRETQTHMATCTRNSVIRPPPKEEIEGRLGKNSARVALAHAFSLTPSVLISEAWAQDVEEVTQRENGQQKRGKRRRLLGRSTFASNMIHQIAERTEYTYSRWKERNEMQIHREEQSAIAPRKRRQIMRQPQTSVLSQDRRTSVVPPIPRPWGDDLLSFKTAALATVALELRVIACDCHVSLPP